MDQELKTWLGFHLKTLRSMSCDHPTACGKGAVCNSCWAKSFGEKAIAKIGFTEEELNSFDIVPSKEGG